MTRPSYPDDALLKLGLRLSETWAAQIRTDELLKDDDSNEADAVCDAAWDRTAAIVAAIEAETADTFLGACVKALAQSWCAAGELGSDLARSDYETTDQRLGAQTRRALLAMPIPLPAHFDHLEAETRP